MKLYAILADIHGNYPALRAVERDARRIARREKYDGPHFICLGDVVDYGPQPNECMAWVREHAEFVILGNHDREVADSFLKPPMSIAPEYWPITLWTRRVLDAQHKEIIRTWEHRWQSPPGLQTFTLFHGGLVRGADSYINDRWTAGDNLRQLRTDYGLFGHTHIQGYFVDDFGETIMFLTCPEGRAPRRTEGWRAVEVGDWEPLPEWRRALLNPGSVGQPRHHAISVSAGVPYDHRAAYLLLRLNGSGKGDFQFRRVGYDVRKTIRLLKRIRWPEEDSGPGGGDIYKSTEDAERQRWMSDPTARELAETLAHITDLLPRLVEERLIPTLLNR